MKHKLTLIQYIALSMAVIFAGCIILGLVTGVIGILLSGIGGQVFAWSLFTYKKKANHEK